MKSNRAVIVQCRLSSTRLPGKAILELGNKPILAWVLESMKKVPADYYYVATDEDSYETILPICKEYGFNCFKGSLLDVLKRFCDLLNTINAETVIRATADNPFLFYDAAIESVEEFEARNQSSEKCEYLTYSGLPHGSGVEIFSASALKKAMLETEDPYDHEHVGPALYNHKDKYNCKFIKAPKRYNYPDLRTTIDTYSDFLRAKAIVSLINEDGPYTTEKIIEVCKSDKIQKPVVLVPSVKKGRGTGHLHRCLDLALKNKCFVYIPDNKTLEECDSLINLYIENGLNKDFIINKLPDETFKPVYVTDAFKMTKEEYELLSINQGIISLDEGSEFDKYSNYLLDIIPNYKLNRKPNKTDYNLLEKPVNVKEPLKQGEKRVVEKILVCLGGEDPAGLTNPIVKSLIKCFPNVNITAIGKNAGDIIGENVEFVKQIPQLRDKLFNYDVVITHYGLTAFESAYAGCGVILLPTTKLHKALAEKYNFAYLPDTSFSCESVRKAFSSEKLYPKIEKSSNDVKLAKVIREITSGRKMNCPICGEISLGADNIISRNETRTYRRCRKCGIVYMSFTTMPEMEYDKSYFFEDYKKQYGKTYEEDFQSIKEQGLRRINNIKKIVTKVKNKTLLDIGCAYGPFLDAAADNKMAAFGTDISEDAVAYVQEKLGYEAKCCAFPEIDTLKEFGVNQFDVVSMWYVIEHFKNLHTVLTKVNNILKEGGIFAFSTPCGEGISAKSDCNNFYEISPADHYSIWEISKAKKILGKYGFKIEKIVSTGHHPERFPIIKKHDVKKGSFLWKVIDKISHLRRLGDTVEFYCRKVK